MSSSSAAEDEEEEEDDEDSEAEEHHHHHHHHHHQFHYHQQMHNAEPHRTAPPALRQRAQHRSSSTAAVTTGTGGGGGSGGGQGLGGWLSVGGRVRRAPGRPRPPTAVTTAAAAAATTLPLLSLAQLQHLQQPAAAAAAAAAGFYKMVQCAGCDRPILDRFLLNVLDRAWHAKCVQCTDCKCNLTDKCFSREGKIYCRADFFRRFGTKCAGCSQGISPSDLVRRARSKVFHLKCFTCMVCRKQLSTGEELYVLDENKFICKQDYLNTKTAQGASACSEAADDGEELDVKPDVSGAAVAVMATSSDPACGGHGVGAVMPPGAPGSGQTNSASAATGGASTGTQGHHAHHPSSGGSATGSGSSVSGGGGVGGGGGGADSSAASQTSSTADKESRDSGGSVDGDRENREHDNAVPDENAIGAKRRGPRTTIKAKQLETLKSAFAATPKPTRHIREQLAQETGLNMRVIQVWFQNRRSKERRMKQLSSMGARRHFFRNPRRMRALRPGMSPDGLDDSPEMVPNSGFGYFSGNQRATTSLSFADNSSQADFAYSGQTFYDFFPGQATPHGPHGPHGPQASEALTFPMVGAQSPAVPGQANTMDGPMGTGNVNLGADAPYLPHGDILSQRSSPDSVLNLPAVGADSFGPSRSSSDVFPALGHSHGHSHGHTGHTHTPMTETPVW